MRDNTINKNILKKNPMLLNYCIAIYVIKLLQHVLYIYIYIYIYMYIRLIIFYNRLYTTSNII